MSKAIDALKRLASDAHRVSYKYGHNEQEDGSYEPSDYTEWHDLRISIAKAKEVLKRLS